MWESCDISVWDFVLPPEILRFCRQSLGEGESGTEPDEDTEDQGLSRRRWERKMGIVLDPTSVGRPSTPADGPGDPPAGKKLLPGRGGPSEGFCLGSSRLACVEGQSGQV